jgi:hypothetical protein
MVTRQRLVNDKAGMAGVPPGLAERLRRQRDRVPAVKDPLRVVLLDGHPTADQLAAGVGKRGNPVSKWNAACDAECSRQAGRE